MQAGIDMEAGASPFLFAMAMDPMLRRIGAVRSVDITSAFVDDTTAGAQGLGSLPALQNVFD